jgi:hypothetical protein
MADAPPEAFERLLRPVAAAFRQTIGEHDGVHGAGAGGADAFEGDALVFQQTVEHAPGEGAVGAAALESEVDGAGRGVLAGLRLAARIGARPRRR